MKRRVLYMAGVLVALLAMSSCSKSERENELVSDGAEVSYVDVEISTQIEANYDGEGYSRASGVTAVDDSIYDCRYTIELWDESGSEVIYRAEEIVATVSQSLSHSFRAVAGSYRLVIFADYVKSSNGVVSASHYTTAKGLDQIAIAETSYVASDSSRDSFGYCEDLEITSSFSLSGIALRRLMAQVTLADTDCQSVTAGSSVAISYDASIPSGYNMLSGEAIAESEITASYDDTVEDQAILAYDYIFVSADVPDSYYMTFEVGSKVVGSQIDLAQNTKTNITATFFATE